MGGWVGGGFRFSVLEDKAQRLAKKVADLKQQFKDERQRNSYVVKPDATRRRRTVTLRGLYRLGVKRNLGDSGQACLVDTVEAQVKRPT